MLPRSLTRWLGLRLKRMWGQAGRPPNMYIARGTSTTASSTQTPPERGRAHLQSLLTTSWPPRGAHIFYPSQRTLLYRYHIYHWTWRRPLPHPLPVTCASQSHAALKMNLEEATACSEKKDWRRPMPHPLATHNSEVSVISAAAELTVAE